MGQSAEGSGFPKPCCAREQLFTGSHGRPPSLILAWPCLTPKPSEGETQVFWKWLNSPSKIKKDKSLFSQSSRSWSLQGPGSRAGGLSLAELSRARTQGKQTHVCSVPPHHLYLTLLAPPLLSFAVSWDLFSPFSCLLVLYISQPQLGWAGWHVLWWIPLGKCP